MYDYPLVTPPEGESGIATMYAVFCCSQNGQMPLELRGARAVKVLGANTRKK